jgi:hypothetical protein
LYISMYRCDKILLRCARESAAVAREGELITRVNSAHECGASRYLKWITRNYSVAGKSAVMLHPGGCKDALPLPVNVMFALLLVQLHEDGRE